MIEAAIYELLHGDTAVAAIVGDRIYPLVAPQRKALAYPNVPKTYVTYERTGGTRNMPLNGVNGFVVAVYRIMGFAYNYELAKTLGESIRLKLDGYRGSAGGHPIQRIWCDNDIDGYEYETDATETAVFQVVQDYRIAYAESVAA